MKILSIAWKDLRSTTRNVPSLVMMLVAPLALAALLGFAFGGGGGFDIAATKVVVANLDRGGAEAGQNAGAAIQTVLTSKDLQDVLETSTRGSASAARQAVDDGKAAVAVIVPEGFSAVVFGSDPRDEPVEVYENPTARSAAPSSRAWSGRCSPTSRRPGGGRASASRARTPPATLRAQSRASPPRLSPTTAASRPACRSASAAAAARRREVGVTGSILAGMMVFFMFFGAANVARTILTEDRDGTMPRLFTTPRRGTIIGGKFVSVFVTVLAQAVVLLIAGRLIFGIQWGASTPSSCSRWSPPAWPAVWPCSSSRSPRRRRRPAPSAPASTCPRPSSAAIHRHGADQDTYGRPAVHPQRLAHREVGHDDARRRRRRHPLAGARALASRSPSSSSPCCACRRRFS
jgi:ABC-2 type transport system permease protein